MPYRTRAELTLKRNPLSRVDGDRILSDLDMAIKLQVDDPQITASDHVLKARPLFERRDYDGVVKTCDQALRLSPGNLKAYTWKIDALLGLKRYEDADAACLEALSFGHNQAFLFEVRGIFHAARKDYSAAIEAYTIALTLDPNRLSVLLVRGWTYLCGEIAANGTAGL